MKSHHSELHVRINVHDENISLPANLVNIMELDITVMISKEVQPSCYEIHERIGNICHIKLHGQFEEISDSFISVGIIREIYERGNIIYVVINKEDMDEFVNNTKKQES